MSANEGWIQCTTCRRWAHDDCAGIGDDDYTFVCDIGLLIFLEVIITSSLGYLT